MDVPLRQRDRSGLEFLGSLQHHAGGVLQPAAAARYEAAVPDQPAGLADRRRSVGTVLADHGPWLFDRFLTRWVAEEIYVRALPAVEHGRERIDAWLNAGGAPGTLALDPGVEIPDYWNAGFHLTTGGWDGHDLMGVVTRDLGYEYVLAPGGVGAVRTGEDILDQRERVAREAPRRDYRRILEPGVGTGMFAHAVARVFPDAEFTGVDLSRTGLEYAHATARDAGLPWRLIQAPAERTGLPDASFDLAAVYILFHETPPKATAAILRELFRVLEPGGDLVIGDVAPYDRHPAFRAVVLDWETEHRGEPFWRSALQLDLPGLLREAGFTDVEAYGAGGGTYPWITRGHKAA
ncbi:class I SAM-dependent methyltransferase [Streptomyces sp. NBC_01754]|uniref:class I SAM-dependent methyltransferase n=1 Tax=Streptomyces sp. NBC_01754 TaxID=2975930 RepID=UPI002DD7AAF1|nr:class I SAM-dependent methyltransferase [Streptomyces sp. NBC_01754]WSC91821.1 class I SAM-dependent methyltransferase [Streptomyces sp. NBC_01754]